VAVLPTTIKRTITTTLCGAAIVATVGAPAASARPADNVGPGQPSDVGLVAPPQPPNAPATVETTPDAGFDLSSAAIGAAAGTGLLIIVLAAGGMAWRRPITRPRRHPGRLRMAHNNDEDGGMLLLLTPAK
jgi:hypothetical protein